jgi:hypothetical protein
MLNAENENKCRPSDKKVENRKQKAENKLEKEEKPTKNILTYVWQRD